MELIKGRLNARWLFGVALFSFFTLTSASERANSSQEHGLRVHITSIVQDFTFDSTGRWMFIQHITRRDGGEAVAVTRARVHDTTVEPLDSMHPFKELGHQGISLENDGTGELWLWASKGGPGGGRDAIRFQYRPDSPVAKVATYTLFDSRYRAENTTMPKVCRDRDVLVARGALSKQQQTIRIFDLRLLKTSGPGDYSNRFIAEWQIPSELITDGEPLQGFDCDKDNIYFIFGHTKLNTPKQFYIVSRSGTLVHADRNVTIGRMAASNDGRGRIYEPEGLAIRESRANGKPDIYVGIRSGGGDQETFRIWRILSIR